jgi:transposase
LQKAVDQCRRREVKQHEDLKRTKYLFLKDKMNFTDKQHFQFEAIKNANYEVSRAWRIKENFRDISFGQTTQAAFSLYRMWRQNAITAQIKEIDKVVETFDRHKNGIINAISTGENNARAERLNGTIQQIKSQARGYREIENIRIAILFFCGKLDMVPHKKW